MEHLSHSTNVATPNLFTLWREIDDLSLDTREIVSQILDESNDFEVNDYRFIRKSCIDEIMVDELSSDKYILGCFNAWFLADVLGIDMGVIEAMKKAEAYEAIGKLVISMDKLEELQQAYASADSYGAHFNYYDGSENELDNAEYYYFKTN